jgi:hypothetical protein
MDLTKVYLFMTRVYLLVLLEKTLESIGRLDTYVRTYVVYDDDVYVVRLIIYDDGALKEAAREDVISGARR